MDQVWHIKLAGCKGDLDWISRLQGRSDVAVRAREDGVFLELLALPPEGAPDNVRNVASEMIGVLNGLGRLYRPNWHGLDPSAVIRNESDYLPSSFVFPRSVQSTVEMGEPVVLKDGSPSSTFRPVDQSFEKSESTSVVQRVLRLLGSSDQFIRQIYVVFEVIEAAVGGQHTLEKSSLCDRSDLRCFKQTANTQALGDASRHGKSVRNIPADPMSPEEAEQFVEELARRWLTSVCG